MKRFLLVLGIMTLSVGVSAQSMYDALRYCKDDYVGTARSFAMGNAFTALGGDLGSVMLNPAGSAVGGYSQLVITPGLNISSCVAQGTTLSNQSEPFCFGNRTMSNDALMALPNLGLCFNFRLGRNYGLKSLSLSLIADRNTFYNDRTYTTGVHEGTSIAGSIASEASGIPSAELGSAHAYYDYPWSSVLGWNSGMISSISDGSSDYVGATEKYVVDSDGTAKFFTAGALNQSYGRMNKGAKGHYLFNFAMNVSDIFYLGMTIGAATLNYSHDEYLKESPVEKSDFEVDFGDKGKTTFKELKYQSWYSASGSGAYAKFGFIVTPGPMRIGASVQTPTSFVIVEKWGASAQTHFENPSFDGKASSPEDKYKYRMRTPWKADFGIACTVAGAAVLSADYEFCDNRSTLLKTVDSSEDFYLDGINQDTRAAMGFTHQLRVGAEFKPLESLALRAGYGFTDTRCGFGKSSFIDSYQDMDHSVSCGLGYSSRGALFADIAFRTLLGHKEYIYPYSDYSYASDGSILHYTPEILTRRNLYTVLLTVGYRF